MVCVSTSFVHDMAQADAPMVRTAHPSARRANRVDCKNTERFMLLSEIGASKRDQPATGAQLETRDARQGTGVDPAQIELPYALRLQAGDRVPQQQIMDVRLTPGFIGPADVVGGPCPVDQEQ